MMRSLLLPASACRGDGLPDTLPRRAAEALTSDAEQLFPKAYDQVLKHLLDVLSERATPQEREEMLRTVGRRFSTKWPIPDGNLQVRLNRAVEALHQLGGLAELEQSDETYAIHGYSCPFAAVAPSHPEICQLAETLLTELVGAPVQQKCGSHGPNYCFFIVQRQSVEASR
jgi:predicted ArsR family transcriptional regulator